MDPRRTGGHRQAADRTFAVSGGSQLDAMDTRSTRQFWNGSVEVSSSVWQCRCFGMVCLLELCECQVGPEISSHRPFDHAIRRDTQSMTNALFIVCL